MLPYLDPAAPVAARVEDLLSRMTLQEKAGLFFHAMGMPGPEGRPLRPGESGELPVDRIAEQIEQGVSHFNVVGPVAPEVVARWHNALQDLAAGTRLGIPVTLSSDPRHGFDDNPATGAAGAGFSQWPEPLGLAATRDVELVREHARVVRRELTAVGIRVLLGPSADLASDPRWARTAGTFGADADLVGELVAAFVEELQGPQLGPTSVAAMLKHFPGAGPQRDGEDAHFPYGREQVYPGGCFDLHLGPFVRALRAGASQLMPYYGMPVGLDGVEPVGFGFNRAIVTGLARGELGFEGIVCTDWGLVTDGTIFGAPMPARAWGVEHLDRISRVERILDAGCDQLGGESAPELVVELVRSGRVTEERIDVSVRRLLAEKFRLGLFDRRLVDVDAVPELVGTPEAVAQGYDAQRRATVVLSVGRDRSGGPLLPLAPGTTVRLEGADGADPTEAEADVTVVRVGAPFEPRTEGFERFFHAGSLEFPAQEAERILALARRGPVVLVVTLDRAAVLEPFVTSGIALVGTFGAGDGALLDVLFGRAPATGRLPIELPSSMDDVRRQREDVPLDAKNPTFGHGHGHGLDPARDEAFR